MYLSVNYEIASRYLAKTENEPKQQVVRVHNLL